jgi:aryl-alcohol dehydrogenase-like predicted oxidoreductase
MITETITCDAISKPISRIGLGTWAIAGWMWGGSDDAESIRTIQHAIDVGINQIHWPDGSVAIEETAKALVDLQREGNILALGVSNHSPEQMETWRSVAPLHSTQPPYNIFYRQIDAGRVPNN